MWLLLVVCSEVAVFFVDSHENYAGGHVKFIMGNGLFTLLVVHGHVHITCILIVCVRSVFY